MAAMIVQNVVRGKTLRSASGAVVRATSNGPSGRAGGDPAASAATVAAAATTASMPMARRETTGPRPLLLTRPLSPRLPRTASPARPRRLRLANDLPGGKSAAAAAKLHLAAEAGPDRASLACRDGCPDTTR